MSDTDTTLETLQDLSSSLTTLEQALDPLLATPFKELVSSSNDKQTPMTALQRAKLDVMTAYIVHDLIWVYLRTAGIDPNSHPVMLELQRVKGYFDKIKHAENPKSSKPRQAIDKEAAARFINAAISNGGKRKDKTNATDGQDAEEDDSDVEAQAGPSGTHIRFDNSDDNEVANETEDQKKERSEAKSDKGKKKARAKIDPFAGYDVQGSTPKSKHNKKKSKNEAATPVSSTATATSTDSGKKSKSKRPADEVAAAVVEEEEGSAKKKQKANNGGGKKKHKKDKSKQQK
ncbi:hypothetical protein OIO90_001012 [Microbotryomycetes sp. JL221]|nr:hypothetical protein OIO90_001012 [Microbotryomycetes sp. JL221]